MNDAFASTDTDMTDTDMLAIDCPRCGEAVTERYYGPCDNCREQLRATQQNDKSNAEAAEYEPKMNVVPNAIASKE